MREDMIDFPVSSWWRDYYYELGLTPYPSPEYSKRSNATIPSAAVQDDRVEKLAAVVRRLAREVAALRQKTSSKSRKQRAARGWQDSGTS